MAIPQHSYALAGTEFYEPIERASERGREYRPHPVPRGWLRTDSGIWTAWRPARDTGPEQGWKVHVSARLERAQHVLDTVAAACVAERVPFKHLSAELFFLHLHHKHGPRPQSGKFCTCYPPDEQSARRLMDRLAGELAGERGPYVLTDRRYRDSRVVHYRYGAFRAPARVRPDGSAETLVRDGSGEHVEDRRGTGFTLPGGITDPFGEQWPPPDNAPSGDGSIRIRGYRVLRAVAHSNAGGTYEAETATGRRVFLKEARAHNGLFWDHSTAQQRLRREHEVLCGVHAAAPGRCPEPLDYFREWEHEFLVTEFVTGTPLYRMLATDHPALAADRTRAHDEAHYARSLSLLDGLRRELDRLHELGYRFGDLSPGNVLVTPDGDVRLVDFEAASPVTDPPVPMGTGGFVPPGGAPSDDPLAQDEYGFAALALFLLWPMHPVAERSPGCLEHLHAELAEAAPIPARLWRLATRNYRAGRTGGRHAHLPTPDEVAARPRRWLAELADGIARDLLRTADPANPNRVFPTVPRGHTSNTSCVAYGTAGVVHALHHAGVEVPEPVLARLRRDALEQREHLPPGLHVGSAGLAWVLADRGLLDEAGDLLDHAARHPLTLLSTTLGEGAAGIGLTHLALHAHTGDAGLLERAASYGDSLLGIDSPTPTLGPHDAVGLLRGRAGLALFLYYLGRVTGEERYLAHGAGLLHAELDRAIALPGDALGFPDDAVTDRAMSYLAAGSGGVTTVLTRYVTLLDDERLSAALPRTARHTAKICTAEPGLYRGLAGLVLAMADDGAHAGVTDPHEPLRLAKGLFKYAVPAGDGIRFLGEGSLRYSAELWSGSSGILLALHRVLHGNHDQFFTLDRMVRAGPPGRTGHPDHATAGHGR
ncbi:class III lanthionine synthetase LanKC [Haloechinothrix sp. LS1_15]|uniref:class III lanthionine synthetase LanKC n=1 Tax=Haloechinothrix sp. LS1_15 TaxID=2652248 RepID=UPI002946E1CB|nr:class III lanthionine synthetase LanKC [Haloechinothrix sp. LS1_15]MDV6011939.1 protein kinase/lanthionine synthetase C family protein [Haloechinothrix sp. LS1_15]